MSSITFFVIEFQRMIKLNQNVKILFECPAPDPVGGNSEKRMTTPHRKNLGLARNRLAPYDAVMLPVKSSAQHRLYRAIRTLSTSP